MRSKPTLKVAIGSLGAIGLKVAQSLDAGEIPGMELSAVSANDQDKLRRNLQNFDQQPEIVPAEQLGQYADIVIECAPRSIFTSIANSAIDNGCTFMPLSVAALLDHPELIERARSEQTLIFVPTGALLGLDAVKAVAESSVQSVSLVTRKPPGGLAGAPYLLDNGIDPLTLSEATQVFTGTAREAARAFPANVNVAAALSLAGIGPDKTVVEVWADPAVNRNMHTIKVVAEASSFTMSIENVPGETPATGKITALSVIASLRRMTSSLVVGT